MPRVIVIGAGPAGLTTAYRIGPSAEVELLEMRAEPGGRVRTRTAEGYRIELGANTIRGGTEPVEALVRDLDLTDARIYPGDVANKRYVVREGRPRPLPSSPGEIFTTDLFSWDARLRLLKEPFVRPAVAGPDETVGSFIERRLGPEVRDYAVDPFLGGVFAGRADQLVLRHVLPDLYETVEAHGSLTRAGLARVLDGLKRRLSGTSFPSGTGSTTEAASGPRRIFTFRGGLSTLIDRLSDRVEAPIRLEHEVRAVKPSGQGLQVRVGTPSGTETRSADSVVYTGPAYRIPEMLETITDEEARQLERVPYPPVAVVGLGYDREAVGHPLDGFGVLVPSCEPFDILGVLFSSTLAPGSAPQERVLLNVFVGGARNPELARDDPERLVQLAHREAARLLELTESPRFTHVHRWRRAIPQFVRGHDRTLEAVAAIERRHPGLYLAGSYRGGISVPDAIASGVRAADQVTGSEVDPPAPPSA